MSSVILSCSSLKDYVEAAQKKENTRIPVIYLDRKYHVEPKQMREKIIEAEKDLPKEIDTILVAMGFCGGSWDQVTFSRKAVIPRVDDCISLLLQKTDAYVPNLKEMGHMYMVEMDPDDFIMEKLVSGRRDEQFLVAEPGHLIRHGDFF